VKERKKKNSSLDASRVNDATNESNNFRHLTCISCYLRPCVILRNHFDISEGASIFDRNAEEHHMYSKRPRQLHQVQRLHSGPPTTTFRPVSSGESGPHLTTDAAFFAVHGASGSAAIADDPNEQYSNVASYPNKLIESRDEVSEDELKLEPLFDTTDVEQFVASYFGLARHKLEKKAAVPLPDPYVLLFESVHMLRQLRSSSVPHSPTGTENSSPRSECRRAHRMLHRLRNEG
jgi:hypothetical protein